MSKIAIIQMRASTDKSKNLKKILDYIGKAAKQGAALCTFPEFMMLYTKHLRPQNSLPIWLKAYTEILLLR